MHFDLSDSYHHHDTLFHRLDPRVKLLLTILVVLGISLTPKGAWATFGVYFLLILAANFLANLGPFFTLRRSFVALPFVMAAVPLPFTTAGEVAFSLPLLGWQLTTPGLIMFGSVLLRTWLAVQVAILMTATTRFPDLLWAMGALRLPKSLVAVIAFMYRYLFVMADEALRMLRARSARAPKIEGGQSPSVLWRSRVAGAMVGSLFLRALDRSERIYAAMLSRGYDGHMRTINRFQMATLDWACLTAFACLAILPVILSSLW